MTVHHVVPSYVASLREGVSRNVHDLHDALRRARVDSRMVTAPVRLAKLNRRATHASQLVRVRRLLADIGRQSQPGSVVNFHASFAATALATRGVRLGRCAERPRLVLSLWNASYERGDGAAEVPALARAGQALFNAPRLAVAAMRSADVVVVPTRFQAAQLEAAGVRRPVTVVPSGVNLDEFRPATIRQREAARTRLGLLAEPVVAYYGHLSAWKGPMTLARTVGALARRNPRAITLVCSTPYGSGGNGVRRHLAQQRLLDRVRFVPRAPPRDVLAAADVMLFPWAASVGTAAIPNVLLESMAAGKAIVGTTVAGVAEAAEHGRHALLSEPGDATALARHVEAFLADGNLRARMGREARARAKSHYDWARAAAGMRDVYDLALSLMAAPAPVPAVSPRPWEATG